jgi:hypothetical protein
VEVGFMKAMLVSVLMAATASAATLEDAAKVTGTFSSLAYNEESGDLGGSEISIVVGGGGHYAIVQCSEGSPGIPVVVKVQVQGQRVSFTLPKGSGSGCIEATYTGTVSAAGLTGQFSGAGEPKLLKRKPGYWQ